MHRIVRVVSLALVAAFLGGCSAGESNVAQGNREGILHFGNGSEPQGLDPHVVTGVPESKIIDALFEGLTRKNPWTLEPEPGAAASWEFSEDRRVITFHMQPEGRWSNGDPVTAHDFVWSWRRALDPAMGNLYAYMLYPVENAEAYATGKIDDPALVGVRALDDMTLEVTLNAPTPYFLQLMDHYSSYAVHRETVERFGRATDRFTRWTRVGNIVTNGPFQLQKWELNRRIVVDRNPHYWDNGAVHLNGIVFYPTENIVSEERMFRVHQLHYTADVPLNKIPAYRKMADTPFVEAPYLGTYFYLLNTERPPLDDVRIRKALSLAVDREALTRNVLYGSNNPAYAITPPGTLGYQPPQLFRHDPEEARRLLAEAGYPGGAGWPGLELIYNTSESHRKIAVALQQMWKDALNITVTLSNQEWKVYLDSVSQMNFQVARRGWIGDYVDPNNFLDLYITDGGNNNTGFSDPVYDELILQRAPRAATQEARFALFHEAETRLMEQMPILPIYTYASKHLVHPSVKGLPPNLMDFVNVKYIHLEDVPLTEFELE
ncbi:peptide ABC transporter substrate-binding protein [Haliea sp.]|uniref:peptide ABC transporter substrate-binding protein n=1 Tax=Haliea sp. TaxID=1932666 RepID=UPI000C55C562|nr:peptide ABC transporter substrate-binding protein [Haliea sp.]MAD65013.1 peptide ABC transporter substrate-binding protein [Haliea sp.]MAY94535.1 peptide ABC transporter substrate-binding protein [Haliea sp.]MBP71540.1 peptide ABC transporter substrate-binding protein [Haliea sp.]HCD56476.1 peptide ABC transporter substrate-binding protein [Halieaceae bacterium]